MEEPPPRLNPFGRGTGVPLEKPTASTKVYRGKARSVPTAEGEKEDFMQQQAFTPTPPPTPITPEGAPIAKGTPKPEPAEPVNVTDILVLGTL